MKALSPRVFSLPGVSASIILLSTMGYGVFIFPGKVVLESVFDQRMTDKNTEALAYPVRTGYLHRFLNKSFHSDPLENESSAKEVVVTDDLSSARHSIAGVNGYGESEAPAKNVVESPTTPKRNWEGEAKIDEAKLIEAELNLEIERRASLEAEARIAEVKRVEFELQRESETSSSAGS